MLALLLEQALGCDTMPSYKDMYYLVVHQTNTALRLLREAKIDKIYAAVDLLENAHKDAEALYLNNNTKPFIKLNNFQEDKDNLKP